MFTLLYNTPLTLNRLEDVFCMYLRPLFLGVPIALKYFLHNTSLYLLDICAYCSEMVLYCYNVLAVLREVYLTVFIYFFLFIFYSL